MKYHRHLLNSCLEALDSIFFENRHADKCIEFYLRKNKKWGSRDRKFFAETVYDCVRWWRLDWYLINQKQKPAEPLILTPSLWRRGLEMPAFDEYASHNSADFLKKIENLADVSIKHSIPYWLLQRLFLELGEPLSMELLACLNKPNKVVLRANTTKITPENLIATLGNENVDCQRLGNRSAIVLDQRENVFRTQAFRNGFFEVQDGSSQQVAFFLDVEPGMRVLDACAGAGGKTLHIADLMKSKGKVVALDIHKWKLDQLKLRARRNSYSNVETRPIDGGKTIKRLEGSMDRVLLDVPCSGLGVLRRNPDTKWKLTVETLASLIELQKEILSDYSRALKPGGKMVYSTCSILPSENQEQVKNFLTQNSNFKLVKQKTIYPICDGFDGFYMAQLEKMRMS